MFKPLPRVSIISPTYNHEKFIEECVESVINQTFQDWEMIIVDDGSTDGTRDIILSYDDPRIILISKEHRGTDFLGDNYNCGLRMARGEFILILEGDDYIPANRLEIQLSAFNDKTVVLCHGKYAYVFDKKRVLYPTPFKMNELRNRPMGSALKIFLQGFNPIGSQSVMIRKSALLDVGGFTQPKYLPLVDYPTWMRLALKGTFEFIPKVLGFWRRHPQSVTMHRNEQIFEGFLRYADDFVASFGKEMSALGLMESVHRRGAIAYLSLAWIKLLNGDWTQALELGRKSWAFKGKASLPFRLKIIVALIGAYFHIDLPSYFKRMNRWLYRK